MAGSDRYSVSKAMGGQGGRERRQKIDDLTDQMVGQGKQSKAAPSESETAGRRKPVYTPSDEERSARVYGTPMSQPLVNKPKNERRER